MVVHPVPQEHVSKLWHLEIKYHDEGGDDKKELLGICLHLAHSFFRVGQKYKGQLDPPIPSLKALHLVTDAGISPATKILRKSADFGLAVGNEELKIDCKDENCGCCGWGLDEWVTYEYQKYEKEAFAEATATTMLSALAGRTDVTITDVLVALLRLG